MRNISFASSNDLRFIFLCILSFTPLRLNGAWQPVGLLSAPLMTDFTLPASIRHINPANLSGFTLPASIRHINPANLSGYSRCQSTYALNYIPE
jgi:hypothetical protein